MMHIYIINGFNCYINNECRSGCCCLLGTKRTQVLLLLLLFLMVLGVGLGWFFSVAFVGGFVINGFRVKVKEHPIF